MINYWVPSSIENPALPFFAKPKHPWGGGEYEYFLEPNISANAGLLTSVPDLSSVLYFSAVVAKVHMCC